LSYRLDSAVLVYTPALITPFTICNVRGCCIKTMGVITPWGALNNPLACIEKQMGPTACLHVIVLIRLLCTTGIVAESIEVNVLADVVPVSLVYTVSEL